MTQNSTQTTWAAVLGALAVILGAFGAHGLKATLELHQTAAIWQTAAQYHLVHAAVPPALGLAGFSTWGWRLMATVCRSFPARSMCCP